MRPRLRRLLRRTAALGLGLVLAISLAEVGLRMKGVPPLQRNPLSGFHQPHPTVGWLGVPDYQARFIQWDFNVLIEHDQSGFRRPGGGTTQAGDDAPQVVFLGDSFTWGWGVSRGEVLTDVLRERIGQDWNVRNMGVNAYGTGQEYLLLRELVSQQRADRVVVMFCKNDLQDTVDEKGGRRPWFELEQGELMERNVPVRRKVSGWSRSFSRKSVALSFLRYNSNLLKDRIRLSLRSNKAAAKEEGQAKGPATRPLPPEPPEDQKLIYERLLAKLREACAAHPDGPEIVIAIIPGRWDVVSGQPSPITRFVLETCAAQGVQALDLTGPLHEAWAALPNMKQDGRPLHFAVDGHWTAAGHAAAARVLHESLDWSR